MRDLNDEKAIFLAALEHATAAEREAYLRSACGDDLELLKRVKVLLSVHQEAHGPLDAPSPGVAIASTIDRAITESPGTLIGPYKLLEQIGEGGFGLVFLAEQQQPVRRKVALKILKPGMDTRQVIARFEAERQALALMDHPNIARVLDAGETDSGRPHFVMELVKGVAITDYCDQNRLSTRDRLELFVHVCQAVQHAHLKGIIHRDIKPSNVLVTLHDSVPVVKVIDFGIAKALGQQLTDKTLHTGFAQMVGTPMYMSPEQAQLSGLDIDTRSDIYSLGVLLYELLTGTPPFDEARLRAAGYDEMRRIIREEEPARPSTRLRKDEGGRMKDETKKTWGTRWDWLSPFSSFILHPSSFQELDWVVMKALEKDRNRRYETASAFAADVQRYLHDEPVLACPPSTWYRCHKFARRHKVALRTAAAAALVLLSAVAGVSWALWDQATRRTEQSARVAETEQTVNAALIQTEQLRKQAGEAPRSTSPEAEAVLALWRQAEAALAPAETALRTGTADERLRQRVLDERQQIGQRRAQAQRRAKLFRDLDDARMTQSIWIETHYDYAGAVAKYTTAFAAYGLPVKASQTEALARRIRAEEAGIRDALVVALDDWRYNAVVAKMGLLAKQLQALAGAVDDDAWRQKHRVAAAAGDAVALRALSREARQLTLPPSSLVLLARSLNSAGQRDECLALLRWGRARHPTDFWLHFELGTRLNAVLGDSRHLGSTPVEIEEAIGCYRAALALRPTTTAVLNNLGDVLRAKNQLDEAIDEYKKAIDLDPKFAWAHYNLGLVLKDKNQLDDAIVEYKKAIDIDPNDARAHVNLGNALRAKNQLDEAIDEYKKAIELDAKLAPAHNSLGNALSAKNQLDGAIDEYRKAIDLDAKFAPYRVSLGVALAAKHQLDDAIVEFKGAIDIDPNYASAHVRLGNALSAKNELDGAIAEYKKAIGLEPKRALAHYNLGNALKAKNQLDDAIAEYKKAIGLQPDYAEAHCNLAFALRFIGQLSASLDCFQRGHLQGSKRKDWPYPSGLWVADAERLVRLEAKLPDVLARKATPTDKHELLGLLAVCQLQHRHVAAARLYTDDFAADAKLADDWSAGHRYHAACCAALAAAGQGTDAEQLDDQEHRRLRQQALAWLRADLDAWSKRLEGNRPAERQATRQTVQYWQGDSNLAGVRDADALQKLPAQEQEEWRKLWADVAALLKKAGNAR